MNKQDKEYFNNLLENMEEKAKCVLLEVNRWKDMDPTAVFRHGYAREKIMRLVDYLKEGEKRCNIKED